jgi:enoyl-CoA hydratase/carnithine racemase
MGLIPGAGGTVSIARRIGRWRLAHMALTGAEITAEQALE